MALTETDITNFETLKRAFLNDDAVLMECTDAESGDFHMTPFCHLPTGNPFDAYNPPG